ncbi:hypothetical protein [Pelagicoccus sp. SDUM812003]|uniref:hypothetical protein n=1 Tax=Pelagicoccus sp. SDUM812003 TaxID=3041267 RepID=UPI00280FFD75|nr:hypothetical protein [Pelagicoccus sp. SDUM812003]MDQ8205037.1 hypothetical protein [Pelagicoccus sp. SDUM812003]
MKARFWGIYVFTIVATSSVSAEPIAPVVYDQLHADSDVYELFHNIEIYEPFGQSFRPGFGAVDFVDLWLLDIGNWESEEGSLVKVVLRFDDLQGEILGESAPVRVPSGYDGVLRFVFRKRIQTELDQRYLVELIHLEGEPAAARNYGELFSPYERGSLFLGGRESQASDLWFRTGVVIDTIDVIETAVDRMVWAGVTPLVFEVWGSSDLRRWEFVQYVASESNVYEFEFPKWSGKARFFQARFSQ